MSDFNFLILQEMKNWKKLLFIFLAYGLTLMHTMVPHQHQQLVVRESVAMLQLPGSKSVEGFLQFLFAADLGENHLEIFKKSHITPFDFSFEGILLLSSLLLFAGLALTGLCVRQLPGFIERLQQGLLLYASASLRAPPVSA